MRYQEAEFDGQEVNSVVPQFQRALTKPYESLTLFFFLIFVHRLIFNETHFGSRLLYQMEVARRFYRTIHAFHALLLLLLLLLLFLPPDAFRR